MAVVLLLHFEHDGFWCGQSELVDGVAELSREVHEGKNLSLGQRSRR